MTDAQLRHYLDARVTRHMLSRLDTLTREERYVLQRALWGVSQRRIARACGIRQPSVCARIQRTVAQLERAAMGGEPLRRIKARFKAPRLRRPRHV